MKWTRAKKLPEIPGVTYEQEIHDGNVKSVVLSTESGPILKFAQGDYSVMGVYVPAPPKKVKRWRLHGKFLGVANVCEDFEHEYQAEEQLRKYGDRTSDRGDIGLKVEPVEVEVEDEDA